MRPLTTVQILCTNSNGNMGKQKFKVHRSEISILFCQLTFFMFFLEMHENMKIKGWKNFCMYFSSILADFAKELDGHGTILSMTVNGKLHYWNHGFSASDFPTSLILFIFFSRPRMAYEALRFFGVWDGMLGDVVGPFTGVEMVIMIGFFHLKGVE